MAESPQREGRSCCCGEASTWQRGDLAVELVSEISCWGREGASCLSRDGSHWGWMETGFETLRSSASGRKAVQEERWVGVSV